MEGLFSALPSRFGTMFSPSLHGKEELGQTNGITPGMKHGGNSSWVWGGKELLKDNIQPHIIWLCLYSLHPQLVNFTGLSPLLLSQERCAGYSGLISQIIYPHCTTPPIFCFLKQKNLLAASELSGAVILNAHVKSKRRQRTPADLQPPPT